MTSHKKIQHSFPFFVIEIDIHLKYSYYSLPKNDKIREYIRSEIQFIVPISFN